MKDSQRNSFLRIRKDPSETLRSKVYYPSLPTVSSPRAGTQGTQSPSNDPFLNMKKEGKHNLRLRPTILRRGTPTSASHAQLPPMGPKSSRPSESCRKAPTSLQSNASATNLLSRAHFQSSLTNSNQCIFNSCKKLTGKSNSLPNTPFQIRRNFTKVVRSPVYTKRTIKTPAFNICPVKKGTSDSMGSESTLSNEASETRESKIAYNKLRRILRKSTKVQEEVEPQEMSFGDVTAENTQVLSFGKKFNNIIC